MKRMMINVVNNSTREWRKEINDKTTAVTQKFQKLYNLEIRNKKGNEFWNNECDAFKHAYMQAYITIYNNYTVAEFAGNYHEYEGRNSKQPSEEEYMDKHNNNVGREIGQTLKNEIKDIEKRYKSEEIDNMIGVRIIEKMQNGEMITNPDGSHVYKGKTVNSAKVKEYRGGDLSKMAEKSYSEKFSDKIREKANNQTKYIINSKSKIKKQSSENGKWVTINGNHVLIN